MPALTRRRSMTSGGGWAGNPLAWQPGIAYADNAVVELGGHLWEATTAVPVGCPPLGVGDGSTADRDVLLGRYQGRVGFGAAVTGGYSFSTIHVTTNADTGAGSLRQACTDARTAGGGWIVFDGNYTITLASRLDIPKNTTVDGRGRTIIINGPGTGGGGGAVIRIGDTPSPTPTGSADNTPLTWNVILHNFTMETGWLGDDVIQAFWESYNLWFDHLSLTNTVLGDGCLDDGYSSTDAIVSWCHIHDHPKAVLIGQGSGEWNNWHAGSWSVHHNNLDTLGDRSWRHSGYGYVHFFNNYVHDWGSGGGAVSIQQSRFLSQNNSYKAAPAGDLRGLKKGDGAAQTTNVGYVRSEGDWLQNSATATENSPELVEDPDYPYTLDTANATLESRITAYAKANPTLWQLVA